MHKFLHITKLFQSVFNRFLESKSLQAHRTRDARGCRFARLRNDIYKSMVLYYIIYIDYMGEKWSKKEL